MANILLGITGPIAAYKAADLASGLTKWGHDVHCVMAADAAEFITTLTFTGAFEEPGDARAL